MPLSWNPGRNPRGAGAYSLLATAPGPVRRQRHRLIGNRKYFRGKIAFFPLAAGRAPASTAVQALPAAPTWADPADGAEQTCSTG
jgi:hypothetical protein